MRAVHSNQNNYRKPLLLNKNWYAYVPSKTERLAADPIGHVDLWGLECKAISDGVQKLKDSATGPTYKLTDIVNTAEYAKTICQNTQYLDDKTQDYIRTSLGDSPDQVADMNLQHTLLDLLTLQYPTIIKQEVQKRDI